MKIIFLCGSLEPGCDGVGDYTRRLAVEMIKHGHQITAIALNDWFLEEEYAGKQYSENTDLDVLRLPSNWSSKQKFVRAKELVDSFNPDWISLQFVSFAFHLKGLHFGLGARLRQLGKGRRWHIMFHELWVGMAVEASFKHVLWGRLQRHLIKNLILALKPLAIHTQSHLYEAQLTRLGFKVDYLPLFSNIPSISKHPDNGNPVAAKRGEANGISFVVFGTIHPSSPVEVFAKEVAAYGHKKGLGITFVFVGRSGPELDHWVSVLRAEGIGVALLGEQPPPNISQAFSGATMGVSTSSIAYIEKSGSVVAMREHGLPVICVSKPSQLLDMQYIAPPYGILEYQTGNLDDCLGMQFDLPEIDTISKVSNLMEEAFQAKT